ncbi:U11/U12 small nuclear ribonucleoprotein 25 kDa protein [Strongylocentrotus purpuratus]|uniref:Ubiquitin-like domain-containing protein n=1 Tax=Strongylocentrotus purpuratus TaxID=7668 RepID=A0A7M7LL16_STRPU|nr:U11/U12 small nuclear ribonucleoprotein 25 kDa protein [Strongylocentrotus purpuratus]XP_011664659.1 U11/U12 small nuclear ribonucleoprotein 25 kDa protein [Strongylocentrotus purpuratus]|eukprot:XP_001199326.2 PREDICTED: U11/U12 small nuclear ribonucleoprotein 25 kDa protein [Strongylocentrotus purpuratus]
MEENPQAIPLPPSPTSPRQPGTEEPLSHVDAMAIVRKELGEILDDPLLKDLPPDVCAEEVNLQIALEYGQAMTVIVRRAEGDVMPVVVMQTATVQDLKSAIKRYFELKQDREEIKKKISWRYVWRSYYLCFEGEKLTDDYKKIRDFGIRNRAEVTFAKRLHSKGGGY